MEICKTVPREICNQVKFINLNHLFSHSLQKVKTQQCDDVTTEKCTNVPKEVIQQ